MMLHVYRALIRLLPRRVRERDMVSLERRSLGIRLALGATPRSLERGVLANGVRLELDSRAPSIRSAGRHPPGVVRPGHRT